MNKLINFSILFGFITISLCQSPCVTPEGEEASCISLYECTHYLSAVDSILNNMTEIMKFFRREGCDFRDGAPFVCCGTVENFQKFYIQYPSSPFISFQNRPQQSAPQKNTASNPWLQWIQQTPSLQKSQVNVNNDPTRHKNFLLLPPRDKCGDQVFADRIVGGNEAAIDEFPWMALLEYQKNGASTGHQCGGMLISDKYVLTAAHCLTGQIVPVYGQLIRVRLGEFDRRTERDCTRNEDGTEILTDCNEPPQDIDVEEYIVHPAYDPLSTNQLNDIALVRLRNNIRKTDFVSPVCLPTHKEGSSPGHNLTVAGWGRTEKFRASPIKLKAMVPYVDDSRCNDIYMSSSKIQISETQFCAGGLEGTDSCTGDSGGPIMTTFKGQSTWYVEGIVSFGPRKCGTRGIPGVYTRVSRYINWILDNLKQ